MADAYCSSCGNTLAPSAQFCGRCGASAGGDTSGWSATQPDATRVDPYPAFPPYQAAGAPYGGFAEAQPPPPPPGKSPWLIVAVVSVVVAVIAVGVILLVANGGSSTPVAGPSAATSGARSDTGSGTASDSASAAPSASASAPSTAPSPQIVTVTRSATLTAPAGGAAAQPAPLSTSQLRSAFESGTPVNPGPYQSTYPDVVFASPSRNIACYVSGGGDGVQCAVFQYDFDQPGPDCDNGAILSVDGGGSATYSGCLTSRSFATGNTLAYGASITVGRFGCISQQVGVSCVDLDTDTGFTLSRQEFIPVN